MTIAALLIPLFAGMIFFRRGEEITAGRLAGGYLLGQMLLWAAFQVIAVPLVLAKGSFSVLFWIWILCSLMIVAFGIGRVVQCRWKSKISYPDSFMMWFILFAVIALILIQMEYYICGTHLDQDDARWIAEAGDAITKNAMFLHNPATGDYLGSFQGEMLKDVYSPFPLYIAVLSKFTGFRPAAMAHTVFAPVLLILSYMAYARLAGLLFDGYHERLIFLLGVAVITMFFPGGSGTAAAFTLIRIWQGKAVVAGVIIPAILSQVVLIQKHNNVTNWLILGMMGCAGSLLSGMGILISLLMIGGYGIYIVACNRMRGVFLWIIAMIPAGVFGVASQILQRSV